MQILDRVVHKLRKKEVASFKVLLKNQFIEETTWKVEQNMKMIHFHVFESVEIAHEGAKFLPSTI